MNKIYSHIDEISWQSLLNEGGPLRWKELLNKERGGSREFIFGLAELAPGGQMPLHLHRQAETGFIISGSGRIRQGARRVELGAGSAMYFAGERPHSIEAIGTGSLRYVCTYACEKSGFPLDWMPSDESTAAQVDILNKGKTRWAVNEEFESWVPTEPSKGFKVRIRYLFDQERGGFQEMMAGIFELDPGAHYTLHFHNHPEIYYVLSGRGVIYVGDSKLLASPGSAIYLGGRVVHGADCLSEAPLRMYWVYGAETVGQNKNWTPVEDIYTEVRRP